jgi:hypothetical protein
MKNARYRAAFERAEDEATETLEKEAWLRATDGREEVVYFQGKPVGTARKPSDLLLIFLLKARKPDVYRENTSVRVSGRVDNQTTVTVVHEFRDAAGNLLPDPLSSPALPAVDIVEVVNASTPPRDDAAD